MKITVAAYGPAFGYPVHPVFDGPGFEDQGPDVPYAERLKLDVEVAGETFLGDVIDEAARRWGVRSKYEGRVSRMLTGTVFYEPEDDVAFKHRLQPWPRAHRIVGPDGQPSWPVTWWALRIDEALAASDAGLIVGDPLRPYFWPVIPQGDVTSFADALWGVWIGWEHLLAVWGTIDVIRRLRAKALRGRHSVTSDGVMSSRPFSERFARPQDLFAYLAVPRSTAEFAQYLAWPLEATENVLIGLGFEMGDDGLWRPGEDPPSQLLYRSVQEIQITAARPTAAELRELLSREGVETANADQVDADQ